MAISRDQILELLVQSRWSSKWATVDRLVYHLASLILEQREFESVRDFLDFCNDPANLRTWLPSGDDRKTCSNSLLETLGVLRAA